MLNFLNVLHGTEQLEDEDNILHQILQNNDKNIKIETWNTSEELEEKLLDIISKEIGMDGVDDVSGFNRSLGADIKEYETFFGKDCAEKVNHWQIIAPVRNMPHGVININRIFHEKYRKHQMELAKRWGKSKRIPKAYGSEKIVYGDKVINIQNVRKPVFPNDKKDGYVANGEIGIACGLYKKELKNNYLNVCFSSQKDYIYTYDSKDFNEEKGVERLELAYALTVHKAQGSQFNIVIIVLAEPCKILSREMIYTALTRQEDKIIIMYNKEPYHLLKYAHTEYSDISRRFTDLFSEVFENDEGKHKPQIVEIKGNFYDEKLIHKTARGELVRSKSEVIIANALYYNNIDYEYEPVLKLDEYIKRPDFKIVDADTGNVWYWEHCGMMSDKDYVKAWEEKERLYSKYGIIEGKNLIVTKEKNKEGLESDKIDAIIKETFI